MKRYDHEEICMFFSCEKCMELYIVLVNNNSIPMASKICRKFEAKECLNTKSVWGKQYECMCILNIFILPEMLLTWIFSFCQWNNQRVRYDGKYK